MLCASCLVPSFGTRLLFSPFLLLLISPGSREHQLLSASQGDARMSTPKTRCLLSPLLILIFPRAP